MTTIRTCCVVVLVLLASACEYDQRATVYPSPVPVTPAAPTSRDLVEFRVEGDLPLVLVRVSNSLDGLTQVSSVLPYTSTMSIAGRDTVFLSIDARAPLLGSFGFLHVAIFVDGFIFREASSSNLNPIATVSGTWRRGR